MFGIVVGYKVNTHESMAFVFKNIFMDEKELLSSLLFTIISKKLKYLWKNLTKDIRCLYDENFKIIEKERNDTKIW